VTDGEHLLLADEPTSFAQAVIRLLQNPELRCRLAENGRRLAEQKYDWRVVLPQLDTVYQSIGK
jgi:polysaccharide biosynthesis protein PslH